MEECVRGTRSVAANHAPQGLAASGGRGTRRRRMWRSRHGDPTTFLTRPISLVLLIAAAFALLLAVLPSIRRKREVVFQEEPV